MNEERFYEAVGKTNGWDFSRLRSRTEGELWDFYQLVAENAQSSAALLDIGTGGGEKVLEIAASFSAVTGIDRSKAMIETAKANLAKTDFSHVCFLEASSETLPFRESSFDYLSSRHAPFNPKEVWRVLKKGGTFYTQQVSEADKANLKEAFGRGQSFGQRDGALRDAYKRELVAAGFSEMEIREYDAAEYLERPEDLLFLLLHTPIIPNFGEQEGDFDRLQEFIGQNQTGKGIRTNSKRFLIMAKK
ncbi:putative methyltransferase YcgJ [Planococcus massiliensis]|uniref:Putative methyltransferase YcgJ n=1 Tax=Planococcus massiliensis TaxID=1499687 RepID=A0A098EHQ4_9BACL|nr:class I SAM-dependent methyltransferase [Planococcus massiliensis]CEG21347.1 putative methyltransferase YcgJ [Planococcus massiliensis]